MNGKQYTVCRIAFIVFVIFLLNIGIINAGVYVVEHKTVFDEIRELEIRKLERNRWLLEWREKYDDAFREFRAKHSNWRRIIDNKNVVGSKYLTGHEYIIGYNDRYDSFFVKDTGVVTVTVTRKPQLAVYEVYSINRNKDLEARKKLEMFEKWREKEQEEENNENI